MKTAITLCTVLLVAACAGEKKDSPRTAPAGPAVAKDNVVELTVTDKGFEPATVKVKAGEPVKLIVTRKTDKTCATELVLPAHDINQPLPLDKPVEIAFTPSATGEIRYGCAMDQMIGGKLIAE